MKRSMGALAIAMAAMTLELDLAEKWPQLWSSLLVLWCTYVPYTSVESEFLANVAVARKSAALRTRPTVFVWVHNIRHKMGKGAEATTQLIQRFNDANKLVADMQLSRKETQVVLTLAFNSSDSFVERLSAYLRKRPMRGSAITHLMGSSRKPSGLAGSPSRPSRLPSGRRSFTVLTLPWSLLRRGGSRATRTCQLACARGLAPTA